MSNRGITRKSVGSGGADLYLPHLRPKMTGTEHSPRAKNFGIYGKIATSVDSSIDGSLQSPRNNGHIFNSAGRQNNNLLSPILKKGSTTQASSINREGFNREGPMMNSFDNSKYKISINDMVNSSKKNGTEEFGHSEWGEPRVQQWDGK